MPGVDSKAGRGLIAGAIALSAFLLFQVEPLIAKLILPWFGGAAALWASCMLFFQIVLLSGYGYAHWLNKQTGAVQKRVHLTLLALSLVWLPIIPSAGWRPDAGDNPLLQIPDVLARTVGLPFLLLSSTSPLLQSWYARFNDGATPYRLFALSNAGSMIGLTTYPTLIEPWITNHSQAWMWSVCYCAFAVVSTVITLRMRGAPKKLVARTAAPRLSERILWTGLAACASALLLAGTNHLTQNIAAIPFLWVLPLSLYLLSFILCFDNDRWYRRWLFGPLAPVSLGAMAYSISRSEDISDLRASIGLCCAAMFVLFMVCHGELALRRPAPEHLTSFYLTISAGGAIGGLFIGLGAPFFFNALYDLPVVLSATGFLLVYLLYGQGRAPIPRTRLVMTTAAAGVAVGLAGLLARDEWRSVGYARVLARNFYGSLMVYDDQSAGPMGPVRVLRNGMIDHGEQFLWPQNRRYPTTYYGRRSGVGLGIEAVMQRGPVNVGMIGLGVGTLTTYARAADRYYIYEINPNVEKIAATQFTFLRDCLAPYKVATGDARLSLEHEPSRHFDLLAVDAFSGDAIPVHLLTREAFRLYWRHLKPDGVLAVHISNKHISLGPVVAMAASESDKQALTFSYDGNDESDETSSDWVLVSSRPGFFSLPAIRYNGKAIDPIPGLRMWTDDYSNLYRILRY